MFKIAQQRDARWWFKVNGLLRHSLVHGQLGRLAEPIVLTEYPKSGGTWLSQMLSTALGIPYPRNRWPRINGSMLIHGCYLRSRAPQRTVVLWRDCRDVMVSFYYHLFYEKPITSARYSQELKAELKIDDVADISTNLPRFIQWCFTKGYPGFNWNHFADVWVKHDRDLQTSYEALSADAVGELTRLTAKLEIETPSLDAIEHAVDSFSFAKQANRKRGEEDVKSFVRKGIVGDWRNQFTREACEVFNEFGGETLVRLGYEQDGSWVTSFSDSKAVDAA